MSPDKVMLVAKEVSKRFRKSALRRGHTTFKTAIINAVTGRGKAPRDSYFEAVSGVTFDVRQGEIVGIIGRNGSGKSTLLKLFAGIYTPDSGNLSVNGRVSALIELGAGFHPDFTGRENIFINGIILGLRRKEIEEKFDEIVSFANLEEFIDAPVRTYSSGMYMRLGFSVAVNVDPDILLIDEVLAVGDEPFVRKCKDRMDSFKKRNKTIILVTHDLGTVEGWCDRALWMEGGKVVADGEPRMVIGRYRSRLKEMEEGEIGRKQETAQAATPEERAASPEAQKRWGSREIEIVRVRTTDELGAEKHIFATGESFAIELDFVKNKDVAEPVFGIGIFTQDGTCCYGTNTHIDRHELGKLAEKGTIRFQSDSLELLEGNYLIDVAVHAPDGYAYDYHSRLYNIGMRSDVRDAGIFRPAHAWKTK